MRLVLINKPNFGKNIFWPQCERSKLICEMLAVKSLSEMRIETLKKIGFVIEIQGKKDDEVVENQGF